MTIPMIIAVWQNKLQTIDLILKVYLEIHIFLKTKPNF